MILAQQSLRPTYDAARLAAVDHPWFVPALVAAALVILAVCWIVYRRDSVELSPGVGWFLLSMRAAAVVAVFAFYLKIEKRVDRVDVVDSRVLILADTSLSLGKTDSDPATDLPPASDPSAGALPDAGPTRIEQVVAALTDGLLVDRLREKHRVDIYRFDAQPNPVLVATRKPPTPKAGL
jgi:hypothetical protein